MVTPATPVGAAVAGSVGMDRGHEQRDGHRSGPELPVRAYLHHHLYGVERRRLGEQNDLRNGGDAFVRDNCDDNCDIELVE